MSNPPNAETPRRTGLSLYANLLDPTAATTPGSIAKAPVVFNAAGASEEQPAKKHQLDNCKEDFVTLDDHRY